MEKVKQVIWRLLVAGVCLLTVSSVARADSLDEQRSRYSQIKQAWDNRQTDAVEQMMPGLQDYPLYPDLEYRQITD
ncbi:murein transglycosylase, partial [Escherichia coli]